MDEIEHILDIYNKVYRNEGKITANFYDYVKNYICKLKIEQIEYIKEYYQYKQNDTLLEDILTWESKDPSKEKVFFILDNHYYQKLLPIYIVDIFDAFLKIIASQHIIKANLDYEIRHLFYFILNNSLEYDEFSINVNIGSNINRFKHYLLFKYGDLIDTSLYPYYKDIKDNKNFSSSIILINNMLDKQILQSLYLPVLLQKDIKEDILDTIKTKRLLVQIYLRTLFSIIDNDKNIEKYQKYYNSLNCKDNIINDAFDKCLKDIKMYKKV